MMQVRTPRIVNDLVKIELRIQLPLQLHSERMFGSQRQLTTAKTFILNLLAEPIIPGRNFWIVM